jgi:hypothetical protein
VSNQDSSQNHFPFGQAPFGKGRAIAGDLVEIQRGQAKIFDGEVAIVARDTPRPTGNELS